MDNLKARFHLPGFMENLKLNYLIIQMMKNMPEYFYDVEIASVYDAFPPSMWNGGRCIGGVICSDDYITGVARLFNNMGIPLRFTFTNPLIDKEHLDDPFCNKVLKLCNNGLNEVIVNSEVLEDYIRKTYPEYKITSSTCKRLTDPERVAQELNKDYHIVVLDYDLNNKWDILEKLPHKEKLEILADSNCMPNCPRRVAEYETVGRQMIAYNEHLKKYPDKPFRMSDYSDVTMSNTFNCPSMHMSPFDERKRPYHVSPELIFEKYLPMGIHQFKISGRGSSHLYVIELLMYYLVKPECRDEARFFYMHNLEKNGVVKIDNV